jgi:uncharacterized protein YfaS (alpha-2-macroglobulin family)
MKTLIATLSVILFSQLLSAQEPNLSYEQLWAKVHKLEREVLTKSALEIVETINAKAKKEEQHSQVIKSLLFKAKYGLILEEDAKLKTITNLKVEISKANFPVKNVLESYLANLYWQYYQQNRYQFYNRTATDTKIDTVDYRTWDLTTLFNEISFRFEQSLANPKKLQKETLKDFKEILYEQEGSKTFRPSLFDVLAHTALDFYKTNENSITRPADKFEISDPELLCEAYGFTQLNIPMDDKTSLQQRALGIYQQLLTFHFPNPRLDALVMADIERLRFIHTNAVFEDKDQVYLSVLQQSAERLVQHEVSALYNHEIAQLLQHQGNTYNTSNEATQWKLKKAIAICDATIAQFPDSRGGQKCAALKSRILASELQLTSEKQLAVSKPSRLLVNYKNHKSLNLKAYAISQIQRKKLEELYPIKKQLAYIQDLKTRASWTVQLKDEGDYQRHSIEIPLPALEAGQYVILATGADTNEKSYTEKSFAFSTLQVTDLAFTETKMPNQHIFQVVDRNTGKPKAGAEITLYYRKNYRGSILRKSLVTDKNGFSAMDLNRSSISIETTKIEHGKETAFFEGTYINQKRRNTKKPQITYKAFVFKDRSIYRPGQALYFKGVLIENDDTVSKVASEETVTVGLYDVNGQKVSEMDLQTNDFGSFTGEFILPNTGLTGMFYLEVYGVSGLVDQDFYFFVEEYKRPKFETSFKPVTETYRVNDSITVKGTANAFAGSTVSGAKVSYRVQRNVNYPQWYYWSRPYNYGEPQEIGLGETTTDSDGGYEITFKALPDLSADKASLPTFSYYVTADVTDINGETRSTATTVQVGYHAMTASIMIDEPLNTSAKNQKINISTQNLNGQNVFAKGVLKMYKLKAPEYVLRDRPWPAPDYNYWGKKDFKTLYPHDSYSNEHDPKTWEKGKLVLETDFDTEKSTQITLKNLKKWNSGLYIIELETKDIFGQKVTAKTKTSVHNGKEKIRADNQLFHVKTDKPFYTVGDMAEITFYSNAKDSYVTVLVEKDKKLIRKEILRFEQGCETITVPVTAEDMGGFTVKYHFTVFNSFRAGSVPISVPYPNTDLEIETLTFRDKLQPGTDETWSFKIKGPKGEKVTAELLTSMYDASLDQFRGHSWNFNPIARPYYYSDSYTNASQSFGTKSFRKYDANFLIDAVPDLSFDSFEWFGLDFRNPRYAQRSYLKRRQASLRNASYVDATIKKGYISGTVYDQDGQPLPGVNVVISGTTEGTQTDFDGNFSIKAAVGKELILTFIGQVTLRQKVSTDNFYVFYMQEDSAALEEVVITGYGVQKRKSVTGAVAMEMAKDNMEMEIADALQGRVAGVNISSAAGAPGADTKVKVRGESSQKTLSEKIDFSSIKIRKNLQETAFFFPQLRTDKDGTVSFSFTTPEALTRWNVQLLGYTKDLKTASTRLSAVTQKELMVLPNPPRFLREGDEITISSKISNLSDKYLSGSGQLELTDVITGKSIDSLLLNNLKTQDFQVDAKGNTQLSWTIRIPKGLQGVQYKIVAKAGDFSDGEQNVLPVLTNRMLVTETLPMWVRSNQTKTFTLVKLKDNTSTTLSNHKLTLEMTSNPAWYAVQALPYLMEYPYECNEQTFSRYYANTLATHIANSNPRIEEVFQQWANTDALLSNLEKNQELKSLLIQETPWLRDAQSESQQKKRIGLLFNLNKMKSEQEIALRKLENNQMYSGAWPWFNGGRENRYITQHIITGLGHLRHLSVAADDKELRMIKKAVRYLDNAFVEEYRQMKKYATDLSKDHLSNTQIQYLYMRSFFEDIKTSKQVDEISTYYLGQSRKYWTKRNLYTKGMLALVMQRNGDEKTATKILRSLKENSIVSDELGMYWKENTSSWYWYQAPIETQALLIEAFSEIDGDLTAIDNLKIWLLKNKQTNQWKTTKATTEAVYALLLKGSDWLSVTEAVDVLVGGEKIAPSKLENVKIEAGTGYYKTSWAGSEVESEMAEVQIEKKGEGIAWGALYWQYFEDLDKITSAETPLQLKKKLFLKKNTGTGETISEITKSTELKVGDPVRVRIELKSDRNMEFLHMKDMRAAGFEPINVLSQYKWQDGLGYYESTKDASTNFFFDYLPKGVYVFEYDVRVNNSGDFSNGITTIQSMYAPEFSSHSEGVRVKVTNE